MKNNWILFLLTLLNSIAFSQSAWIRINQAGYLPQSPKVAVLGAKEDITVTQFRLIKAENDKPVETLTTIHATGAWGPFTHTFRLDFSDFREPGMYYLQAGDVRSPLFRIGSDVYDGSADFLLKYMRQNRCGYNPFLRDSCHTHDGYTVYSPLVPDGTPVDVVGGWHDAADYLQYTATSANATYTMLMAWRDFPGSFSDGYDANGLPGANGLDDIVDETNWGLNWLLKMHPAPDQMYNQIADDRDHMGWRLPNNDTTRYGEFTGRPVYFCSGEPQGLMKNKSRATGTASTAGKFTTAFALAAQLFPADERPFRERAESAWKFGLAKPGACQTAPCRAPYFYEEDNWSDDMELGGAELFGMTGDAGFIEKAFAYAQQEPVTPWMGADSARHYQWYPFFNMGHYELARQASPEQRARLAEFYRQGIENVYQRGKDNPFLMGVPFIWCSNNLVTAFVTQCYLYRQLTGDERYLELEAAMRDWLFGCNPWGVSMVIGYPQQGVTPSDSHSAFSNLYDMPVDGGLVDGPVYGSIFRSLKYVALREDDEYAPFQSRYVVYHDDVGDYSTNEATMDGSGALTYYLAAMQAEGRKNAFTMDHGAVVRGDRSRKEIALVFTGDEYADGGEKIRQALKNHSVPGSFFFTGKFYRNAAFTSIIKNLIDDRHYIGAHSDQHLLYCDWSKRDSLLVSEDEFTADLDANYREMARFGISREQARFFLPPYEWYNEQIAQWTRARALQLVNYSPGTLSHADYTVPNGESNYYSSEKIMNSILSYEAKSGLNGFILLSHIGTAPQRTDKFYDRLNELLDTLQNRGYRFVRVDELLR
jgi:endoglucanase